MAPELIPEDYADWLALHYMRLFGQECPEMQFVQQVAAQSRTMIPFEKKMARLVTKLNAQFEEPAKLEKAVKAKLRGLGYGG